MSGMVWGRYGQGGAWVRGRGRRAKHELVATQLVVELVLDGKVGVGNVKWIE